MKDIISRGVMISLMMIFIGTGRGLAQDGSLVASASNQFAFDLYSRYQSRDGNVFYSPFSITSALAMTYEGARGKTAQEMRAVFHFPEDAGVLRGGYASLYAQINSQDAAYQLSTANALWAQEGYPFLEGYFDLVQTYYGGRAVNLDFVNQTEPSRLTINAWVEEQTNQKIRDLIPQGMIHPLTQLVLTNAVYFKGQWVEPFDPKDTVDELFKLESGKTITVPMMRLRKKEGLNYGETKDLKMLELPYYGGDLSMFILLPKKENNLKMIESGLTYKKFSGWKALLRPHTVDVVLPRFKFETKYFMEKDLAAMGMPAAFRGREADFSGMTGRRDLSISQVIHQAFVDVNEKGTEAAAATAVIMKRLMPSDPVKVFRADHPFIFIIEHRETRSILFIGRLSDPSGLE